ncbi:MAG: xylulokinase [Chthoniobacterales bacterium]
MIALGLDCGTQSTKCIALEIENGETLASAQKSYGFVPGLPEGHFEQNPKDWIDAAESTITEVLDKLGHRRKEIRAIGVSGQQHGLVALDEKNTPIRPAKLWCDTSTTKECEEITEKMGGAANVIAACGNAMLPGYTLPKILWLKKNEPENYTRVRQFLLPHDYLNFWLTRQFSMEYGDASGTALLDVRERKWSKKLAETVDIPEQLLEKLPPLKSSVTETGLLRDKLMQKWQLDEAVLVSAGGGDNMMGAIGTGNVTPGTFTASLGTSGTLYAFSEHPIIDPVGEIAAFCDSTNNWLPLVCTMNLTLVTERIAAMGNWNHQELDRRLSAIPAGANGLLCLPYLTGERTPNLPHGSGVLHGIRTDNFDLPHLARAAAEGVTLGLGYGLSRFRELGVKATEIRLTGGGSNSPAWRQICASVFNTPVVCLKRSEGAALGAAIQAAWTLYRNNGSDAALRDFTDRIVVTDETTRTEPKTPDVEIYQDLLIRSNKLRNTLANSGWL